MKTEKLTRNYKLPLTPMQEDAELLRLYREYKETGSAEAEITLIPAISVIAIPYFTLNKFVQEKKNRDFIHLQSEFLIKWEERKQSFTEFPKSVIYEVIKDVSDRFLSLNPEYITFELTDDCSVFFQTRVNGNNIYLELFFDHDLDNDVEAILNIYRQGQAVLAYGGSIENTFSKIYTCVSSPDWYIEPTASYYGIPEPTFAPATL